MTKSQSQIQGSSSNLSSITNKDCVLFSLANQLQRKKVSVCGLGLHGYRLDSCQQSLSMRYSMHCLSIVSRWLSTLVLLHEVCIGLQLLINHSLFMISYSDTRLGFIGSVYYLLHQANHQYLPRYMVQHLALGLTPIPCTEFINRKDQLQLIFSKGVQL